MPVQASETLWTGASLRLVHDGLLVATSPALARTLHAALRWVGPPVSAAASRAFNAIFTNAEMDAIPSAPLNGGADPVGSGVTNTFGYITSGSGAAIFKYDGTNGFQFKL